MPAIATALLYTIVLWLLMMGPYLIYVGYYFHRWDTSKWRQAIRDVATNETHENHEHFWVTAEKLVIIATCLVAIYCLTYGWK